jgi:hypothetical protein
VEYERPLEQGEANSTHDQHQHHTNSVWAEPFSQQGPVEMFSNEVLLGIFRHYVDDTPRLWHMLARVCQRWRQIVFTSPLGLNLRLYCTYWTPVLKTLDCWPALPIIAEYGGFPNLGPPAPEDDDNIMAALKQFGRVSSIALTATSSLVDKLSAISEPFSELEHLALLAQSDLHLTLPSTFRWGSRLRTLHTTGIAFPSFPQLLLPSQGIIDIQLHEIPSAGYFSPEALANALIGTPRLQSLSLHFLSFPPRRKFVSFPPRSGDRVVLPALNHLKYRGTSKYLDCLVARIDAPRLGSIVITFFSQPSMDASQLGQFINRIQLLQSHDQASIRTSEDAISIAFPNSKTSTPLQLQISCKQLDWQLSSMAQACEQLSPFLFCVEELHINTTRRSSGQHDISAGQVTDLIRSFGNAKYFSVPDGLRKEILCALARAEGESSTVLPALRHLHVKNSVAMDDPSSGSKLKRGKRRLRT